MGRRQLNEPFLITPFAMLRTPEYGRYFDGAPIGFLHRLLMSGVRRLERNKLRFEGGWVSELARRYEEGELAAYFTLEDIEEASGFTQRHIRSLLAKLRELKLIQMVDFGAGFIFVLGRRLGLSEDGYSVGSEHEGFFIDSWETLARNDRDGFRVFLAENLAPPRAKERILGKIFPSSRKNISENPSPKTGEKDGPGRDFSVVGEALRIDKVRIDKDLKAKGLKAKGSGTTGLADAESGDAESGSQDERGRAGTTSATEPIQAFFGMAIKEEVIRPHPPRCAAPPLPADLSGDLSGEPPLPPVAPPPPPPSPLARIKMAETDAEAEKAARVALREGASLPDVNAVLALRLPEGYERYSRFPRFGMLLHALETNPDVGGAPHVKLSSLWRALAEDVTGANHGDNANFYLTIRGAYKKNLTSKYSLDQCLWTLKRCVGDERRLAFLVSGGRNLITLVHQHSGEYHELRQMRLDEERARRAEWARAEQARGAAWAGEQAIPAEVPAEVQQQPRSIIGAHALIERFLERKAEAERKKSGEGKPS